jgi:predicted DsbA family dithiol-disulfide isomerase
MARVHITYYLDVLSSWCLVAEDAVVRLREGFGDRIRLEWKIAALRDQLGYRPDQLAWYYRRTEAVSGVRLNPVWLRSTADGTRWANFAAEAARARGVTDDRVRLAIARAAMIDGLHVGDREVAVDVAARASGLSAAEIDKGVDDPATAARIAASSAELAGFGVTMRPTFVLRNGISDATVLSGCWRHAVLAQNVSTLLDDETGYETFNAHNPAPEGVV